MTAYGHPVRPGKLPRAICPICQCNLPIRAGAFPRHGETNGLHMNRCVGSRAPVSAEDYAPVST